MNYRPAGPASWLIKERSKTPCRICNGGSSLFKCDYCDKTCCSKCKVIEHPSYEVKCFECNFPRETHQKKLDKWAEENNLAQCRDCGEYVPDKEENIFEDNETYCRGCMKYMKSLLIGEQK